MNFHKKRGIGLLELMLSLVVIGILLLMVTRYFGQARESLKVTQTIKDIHTLVHASFRWVEGQPNFSNLSGVSVLVDAGELSRDWNDKTNAWGGNIEIHGAKDDGKTACSLGVIPPDPCSKIAIVLTSVPATACKNIDDIMRQHNMAPDTTCDGSYATYYPASS